MQNYPNPFNSETIIKYQLPEQSYVTITAYNLLGQKLKTLVNKKLNAGIYRATWDGKDKDGKNIGSGIYFYQIKTKNYQQCEKMIMVR